MKLQLQRWHLIEVNTKAVGPWAPTGACDTKRIICVDTRTSTEGSLLWKSQQWLGVKTLGLALSSMQCTNALFFQLKMHHWITFLAVNDSIAAGPLALDQLVRNSCWGSLSELLELCAGMAERTPYLRDKWQICLCLCIDPSRRTGCMTFDWSVSLHLMSYNLDAFQWHGPILPMLAKFGLVLKVRPKWKAI